MKKLKATTDLPELAKSIADCIEKTKSFKLKTFIFKLQQSPHCQNNAFPFKLKAKTKKSLCGICKKVFNNKGALGKHRIACEILRFCFSAKSKNFWKEI